jgi:hypothetical protein
MLREPIKDDEDNLIESVTINLPLFGAYKASKKVADGDQDAEIDALITACTGLSQSVIEKLKTPDYNSIEYHVLEFTTRDADYFFAKAGVSIDKDKPQLLVPVGHHNDVDLYTPSVKASRVMDKVKITSNPYAQAEYITTACCDLMVEDIDKLSVPDWNQLQNRINSFLNEASSFFV